MSDASLVIQLVDSGDDLPHESPVAHRPGPPPSQTGSAPAPLAPPPAIGQAQVTAPPSPPSSAAPSTASDSPATPQAPDRQLELLNRTVDVFADLVPGFDNLKALTDRIVAAVGDFRELRDVWTRGSAAGPASLTMPQPITAASGPLEPIDSESPPRNEPTPDATPPIDLAHNLLERIRSGKSPSTAPDVEMPRDNREQSDVDKVSRRDGFKSPRRAKPTPAATGPRDRVTLPESKAPPPSMPTMPAAAQPMPSTAMPPTTAATAAPSVAPASTAAAATAPSVATATTTATAGATGSAAAAATGPAAGLAAAALNPITLAAVATVGAFVAVEEAVRRSAIAFEKHGESLMMFSDRLAEQYAQNYEREFVGQIRRDELHARILEENLARIAESNSEIREFIKELIDDISLPLMKLATDFLVPTLEMISENAETATVASEAIGFLINPATGWLMPALRRWGRSMKDDELAKFDDESRGWLEGLRASFDHAAARGAFAGGAAAPVAADGGVFNRAMLRDLGI